VIVEDSDATRAPRGAETHLNMWMGGQESTKQNTDNCKSQLAGKVPARINPPDGLPVIAGPIDAGPRCQVPRQPDGAGSTGHSN
jgi:hypothetical protein